MQRIDVSEAEAEEVVLFQLGRHVPLAQSFARPLVAKRDGDAVQLVTKTAFGGCAQRARSGCCR